MIAAFLCAMATPIDGDTFVCSDRPEHVRLARIDAPELPGHCARGRSCASGDPWAARDALARLLAHGVRCQPVPASPRGGTPYDRWGRIVARCAVGGVDVGAAMIASGLAIRWPQR